MRRILFIVIAVLSFLSVVHGMSARADQTPSGQVLPASALANCTFEVNCFVEWDDNDPIGSRTPLVIIHGWNPDSVPGRPKADLFEPFLIRFQNDATLKSRFKIYFFTYFSNVVSIAELGNRLNDDLNAKGAQSFAFASRPVVILAHSMGGLIARAYMSQTGGSKVLKLITLGTPHHGSPMANGPARDVKTIGLWGLSQILFDNLYFSTFGPAWFTSNRSDLRWDNFDGKLNYSAFPSERNSWLEGLNVSQGHDSKIIAYVGNYAPAADCSGVLSAFAAYCYGATVLGGAMGLASDGIVPLSSASLVNAQGAARVTTRVFDGYNHSEIASGRADGLHFSYLRSDLLSVFGNVPAKAAPFGSFDTPGDSDIAVGEVPVTGWALDDGGVASVDIYVNSAYVGSATFIEGARPDVADAYPNYPNSNRAGWGYMLLSNFLPNQGTGTFVFTAYARDRDGNSTLLGTKSVIFRNSTSAKPFGTIDTPQQGETVSGVITNFGWALTPWPNSIPTDGSTIGVYVDGQYIGHPVYNNYRADIAGAFPGFKNSNGAVGYIRIDTRTLTNDIHILGWLVRDSAGNVEGIGSRYFTVRN